MGDLQRREGGTDIRTTWLGTDIIRTTRLGISIIIIIITIKIKNVGNVGNVGNVDNVDCRTGRSVVG